MAAFGHACRACFDEILSVLAILGGWLAKTMTFALIPFIAHPEQIPLEGAGGVNVARMAIMAAAPVLGAVLLTAALALPPPGDGVVYIFLAAFLYFPEFRGGLYFPLLPCGLLYFPGT